MGRQPCCDKVGIKRGPWTIEEDYKLSNFILNNGIQCWRLVPKLAGLMRCGKSCRLRWINYLRPDLKRGAFTEAEEDVIIQLHSDLGNRWSKIAAYFPGRTDNEIKNHWNTKIKRKMKRLGLDPITHKNSEQQKDEAAESECNMNHQDQSSIGQDSQKQKIEGTSNSELNEDIVNIDDMNETRESSEIDSFVLEKTKPSDAFAVETLDPELEDPFQYWIGSPLSWDVFSNF